MENQRSIAASERRRLIGSTILGICWVALPPLLGFWIIAEIGPIGDWLRTFGGPEIVIGGASTPLYGLLVYSGCFMVCCGLGILPTYAQAILGGWVFGFWLGTPAALIGFTGGSAIGWLICRAVSRDSVARWIDRKPRWAAVRHAFLAEGFWKTFGIVTLIRIPPNSPFSLTNLAMSAGGAKLAPYLAGTFIGMTPRTAITCGFAAAAAADGSKDIQAFMEDKGILPIIIGVIALIIVFSVLAKIANHALAGVLPPSQEA